MSQTTANRRRRPILEALEGKQLLSAVASHHAAEGFLREAPIQVDVAQQYTILTQLGGAPTGAPGQVVTVNAGLAASSRSGIYFGLVGRRVDLYAAAGAGWAFVGSSSTNRMVISGHDTYGEATFSYRVPAGAPHRSVIRLQFRFAGDQLDGPSTGSGQVDVR